jgi:hypothetical protein
MPEVTSVGTHTYLFADDTKAFRGIFQQSDCVGLQMDIQMYMHYKNGLISGSCASIQKKCKAMRIGKSRIDKIDYTLNDGLQPMEYVESEKDIGVVMDNKLTFNQHISEKINKANSIMGVLRRTIYGIHGLYNIQTIIYSFSKATFRIC